MKSAIEHYIDEKILHNQNLLKERPQKERDINWSLLKKEKPPVEKVEELKRHWDTLSIRGTHLSSTSIETPIKKEEFNKIIDFLKS